MSKVEQNLNIVQKIAASTPAQIVGLPEVADRFRNIYALMNAAPSDQASSKYEVEKFHFMKLINDNASLQTCTKLSLYGCFLDMAVNGLSFDPSLKHAYIVPFNTNVGTKDNPRWEKRASLMISGYGELIMRVQQKQIKYADNPVLVYEGDEFMHGTTKGTGFVEHKAFLPRKSDNIIGCYIRLERIDGSVDYRVLSIEEIMKFKNFSKDPKSMAWDPNKGLPGMIQAKTMKHAFRSYPKVRLGKFSKLNTDQIDQEGPGLTIDYGVDVPMATEEVPATDTNDGAAEKEPEPPKTDKPEAKLADDSFVKKEEVKSSKNNFSDDEF